VVGKLEEDAGLLKGVERAKALVTDADDHDDSTFIMMAASRASADRSTRWPRIRCTAADAQGRRNRRLHADARAGAALAAHASPRIRPQVDGLNLLDERIGLTEYRVHPDSPLAGRTLARSICASGSA